MDHNCPILPLFLIRWMYQVGDKAGPKYRKGVQLWRKLRTTVLWNYVNIQKYWDTIKHIVNELLQQNPNFPLDSKMSILQVITKDDTHKQIFLHIISSCSIICTTRQRESEKVLMVCEWTSEFSQCITNEFTIRDI